VTEDRDFDFEPLPGLPAPLPEGERMVWRGAPDPLRLAVRACRLRWVAGYFGLLAAWQIASGLRNGAALADIGSTLSFTATLAAVTLALLALLGWVVAKNAVYTVTSRRIIIRHGVAMPMAINVPFATIEGAGQHTFTDGTADITFRLMPGSRVPHLLLWPHARPGRYWPTEPMLRAVPDGQRVARLVSEALAAAGSAEIGAAGRATAAVPEPVGLGANPGRRIEPAATHHQGAMPNHTVPAT